MSASQNLPGFSSRRSGAVLLAAGLVSLAALVTGACGSTGDGAHGSGAAAGTGAQDSGGTAGSGATSGGTTGKGGSGSGAATSGGTSSGGTSSGGSSANAGSGATIGNAGDGTTGGSAGSTTTTTSTACNNGIDDDGDGLVDGLDPECTGAFDQDEGSFATGIPGDNQDPKWQDCFFDGNSGAGDDGCRYATGCLTGDLSADDQSCDLAQQCIDYCARLTPNGCDCFGCCTVQAADGTSVDIFTTSTCSLAELSDEAACPRCQKSTQCQNTCGECELCPGKTEADLPASCTPPPPTGEGGNGGAPDGTGGTSGTSGNGGTTSTGGTGGTTDTPPPTHTCDGGEAVCGTGLPSCGAGLYCQLGCCMPIVR